MVTLRARLAEAEALHWKVGGACSHCSQRSDYAVAWPCETAVALAGGVDWDCGQCWVCEVRAAVAEPTGQDHRCSPYWSRSICGGCGGQEANCDKCGRLMCCEPTGQEGDRPHDCRPIYSRSVCGQCGGQEQWCETCSRQMCGCATDGQEGDHA